ncbi:MAG TPA: hypothetical protein VKV20_07055 [Ktedonobacteraceae bacterium]|nr:hypothetical protein [Ktedonobacteraceae bacterium]
MVVVLAGKAFGGVEGPGVVAHVTIGTEQLVGLHRGAACCPGELGEDTAEGVGEQEIRAVGGQVAQELAAQVVVVGVGLVAAAGAVEVVLQAEGGDGIGGATTVGGAFEDAVASRIVGVPFAVGGAGIPFHEAIEVVVGEGRRGEIARAGSIEALF